MPTRIIDDDFERLPGLFAPWDVARVLEPGRVYLVEEAGATDDGRALFMVFARPDDLSDARDE